MNTYFLDTETTGFSGDKDRIVELAIVHESGQVVFDSLLNPLMPIPYRATSIHGITDRMVASAPTFNQVWAEIQKVLRGNRIVIYNASFDKKFFPDQLACMAEIRCAMVEFAKFHRQAYGSNNRKFKLVDAAELVGHIWHGDAHRALADTYACRSVWFHLNGLEIPKSIPIPPRQNKKFSKSTPSVSIESKTTLNKDKLPPSSITRMISSEKKVEKNHTSKKAHRIYWIIGVLLVILLFARKLIIFKS